MFLSFFRLGIRNLFRKNRFFTMINLVGLSTGLASILLISLYIYNEYSFDRFHTRAGLIYRVVLDFASEGNTVSWAKTSAPVGHYLMNAYTGIESVVRIRKNPGTDLLANDDIHFYEKNLLFADSTLFRVFDFKLKSGNSLHALDEKNSIVITEALARKYFKDQDPLGQSLRLNNTIDLQVTGILEPIPSNSHLAADAFITFSSLQDILGWQRLSHWGQFDHYTYVLLAEESRAENAEQIFSELLRKNAPVWASEKIKLHLQPLTSIHFHSHRKDEITPNSKPAYSHILGTIAVFILLMALVNFISLSTATQMSRARETSIQKMLGADRRHLSLYFLVESTMTWLAALLLALLLVRFALPHFNTVTGQQIPFEETRRFLLPLVILVLTMALASAAALVAGQWSAGAAAIKYFRARTTSKLRAYLLTFQLTVSIVLVIATFVVSSQSGFLNSMRRGFSSEHVIVIPVRDRSQNARHQTLVNQIRSLPGVEQACFSSSTPGNNNSLTYTYTISGSRAGEQPLATFLVDENFLRLYDMEILSGHMPDDTLAGILINEAAVAALGLTDPIGQTVTGKVTGRIAGVVRDFNYASLHSPVGPLILYYYPPTFRFVSVKVNPNSIRETIAALEKKWPDLYPGYPLEYRFLDDEIEQLYAFEHQLRRAYGAFSVIAVVIAGIGVVGLTSYLMARKQKEISIRKIFGGSSVQLTKWIYSGYVGILGASILISWIISFFWMTAWLNNFAFRTEMSVAGFAVPTALVILFLLVITGFQILKAARTNAMDALREE